MHKRRRSWSVRGVTACLALAVGWAWVLPAAATDLTLRDGRLLSGKMVLVASLTEQPRLQPDLSKTQSIVLLDDELRRTYFPKMQVTKIQDDAPTVIRERFRVRQMAAHEGRRVQVVGMMVNVQPFDDFGRRIFTMTSLQGDLPIVQGITEITPEWTKVEGLKYVWDMRMATTSIPRDTLARILAHTINARDVEQRMKVARFYIQSERYDDARKELEQILQEFPDKRERLAQSIDSLRQMGAEHVLRELRLRRSAGQHRLVSAALATFPVDGVNGATLQAVREMAEDDKTLHAQQTAMLAKLDELSGQVTEATVRDAIAAARKEIAAELSPNTLPRLAPFQLNMNDDGSPAGDRVALALSGWLLGADNAVTRLSTAVSAWRLREVIRQYMSEATRLNRVRGLTNMNSEEAAGPPLIAAIVANMKPPVDTPPPADDRPGFYELEVPGVPDQPPARYLVQLPPEYDPLRRYPTVVTLHKADNTALSQIEWWAGEPDKNGRRTGQAGRRGYIIVAPLWAMPHQSQYGYSAREHTAVLDCLRDACRRFSIDTDRVFLSGHSLGGDAAWDLGLAHPDLWAGMICVDGHSDKVCPLYWENGKTLPMYFIGGELDGGRLIGNARDLDRYLTHAGFNVTVVQYLGRGREDFHDDILHIFEWMDRFKRNFFPREINCTTMRSWDSFFWWLEIAGLPPNTVTDPAAWPRDPHTLKMRGTLTATNGANVRAGTATVNVWLAPQMVDFTRRTTITVNGRALSGPQPSLQVLLEDARTRADRQHPFWAKLELSTGRSGE